MKNLILIVTVLFFSAFSFGLATVDLNTASQAQIEQLPDVGVATAKKIMAARPIKSMEDLKNIKGVGAKADKLKDMVSFSSTTATKARTSMTEAKKEKVAGHSDLAPGQKISLNSASKEDLMKLPDIGEKKAELIMQNRPFKSLDDVKKVKGIKEATFAKIKDNLTL